MTSACAAVKLWVSLVIAVNAPTKSPRRSLRAHVSHPAGERLGLLASDLEAVPELAERPRHPGMAKPAPRPMPASRRPADDFATGRR